MSTSQPVSARSTVKRNARRAVYTPDELRAILEAQQVCHVAYVEAGEPRQIATLYMIDGDHLYLHGNRQAAFLKHLAAGGEACISVTIVDGVVVARSGFHCSMNYRSVTVFGCGEAVEGAAHARALDLFVAALVPGHEQAVREPTPQEMAATSVVRVPLTELAGKVRSGDPIDDEGDLDDDVWAGVIPVAAETGTPQPSGDLKADVALPAYVRNFQYRG